MRVCLAVFDEVDRDHHSDGYGDDGRHEDLLNGSDERMRDATAFATRADVAHRLREELDAEYLEALDDDGKRIAMSGMIATTNAL